METISHRPPVRFVRRRFGWIVCVAIVLLLAAACLSRNAIREIITLAEIHRQRLFTPVGTAPGLRSEIQFLRDLGDLYVRVTSRADRFEDDFKPLVKEIGKRQAKGKNVSCSTQIYRELRWYLNFTSDDDTTRKRIADLKASLDGDADQSFADAQSPDGSWGAATRCGS